MNNSLLYCPHNILLSHRCTNCVVDRRVSYSNRLRYLTDLTYYENRLLNLETDLSYYRNNLINYIELQIRNKIISDINYLLLLIDDNPINQNIINIIDFYTRILREINLFNPSTYNFRTIESITNTTPITNITPIRNTTTAASSIVSLNDITQRRITREIDSEFTFNNRYRNISTDLILKDLNKNSELIVYNINSSNEEEKCSICLDTFQDKTIIRKLNCNHFFHYKCIDKWFEHNKKCPVCRNNLSETRINSLYI